MMIPDTMDGALFRGPKRTMECFELVQACEQAWAEGGRLGKGLARLFPTFDMRTGMRMTTFATRRLYSNYLRTYVPNHRPIAWIGPAFRAGVCFYS